MRRVGVISLEDTKTAKFFGRRQFAVIHDEATLLWLEWLLAGLQGHQKLWSGSTLTFRAQFSAIMKMCGLGFFNLLPSGLRPGGTTMFFLAGINIEQLQFWGRWKSRSSMAIYVQEAMACMVMAALPEDIAAHVEAVIAAAQVCWSCPPIIPLAALTAQVRP